ncbi:MAG TPA: hypothetical protein DCS21_10295, partial [Gammaproteobacteria bacterium]|nr:hypothetical protein [Gammaproteobacteria bacterium]
MLARLTVILPIAIAPKGNVDWLVWHFGAIDEIESVAILKSALIKSCFGKLYPNCEGILALQGGEDV